MRFALVFGLCVSATLLPTACVDEERAAQTPSDEGDLRKHRRSFCSDGICDAGTLDAMASDAMVPDAMVPDAMASDAPPPTGACGVPPPPQNGGTTYYVSTT